MEPSQAQKYYIKYSLELYKGDKIITQAVNKPRINISLPKWQFMGF